jgi:hypothetical protein
MLIYTRTLITFQVTTTGREALVVLPSWLYLNLIYPLLWNSACLGSESLLCLISVICVFLVIVVKGKSERN